jgi:predicted ATP-grasp superfamily ATP-dependent carboligase
LSCTQAASSEETVACDVKTILRFSKTVWKENQEGQIMKIYVYEHLTITGVGKEPDSAEHGMYREGWAMWSALREDLSQVEGVKVVDEPAVAEAVIVIAPETGGVLAELSATWDRQGVWRLGPSLETIRLTTDKWALAEHWRQWGVPTPSVRLGLPRPEDRYPLVWKPRDGCGSQATFLVRCWEDVAEWERQVQDYEMMVQDYVSGQAASVAFLCGPRAHVSLLPAYQHLSTDGRFQYQGGSLPLPTELSRRAVELGERAIAHLPGLKGYVGVDLVLGEAADGSQDYAIEINPRLTTSYIGLRVACLDNLAQRMIDLACGRQVDPLRWKGGTFQFSADGSWSK